MTSKKGGMTLITGSKYHHMKRTLETQQLKMEIKRSVPSPSFQQLVDHAQVLVEKHPQKDTQWVAQQLSHWLCDMGFSAMDNQIHRYRVDDQWVVALRKGRFGLPDVLIYVDKKVEAA